MFFKAILKTHFYKKSVSREETTFTSFLYFCKVLADFLSLSDISLFSFTLFFYVLYPFLFSFGVMLLAFMWTE